MDFTIFLTLLPAVIIFLYGIENFSREIQKATGAQFAAVMKWSTKSNLRAVILGAGVTAFVQSSAATTIIAMGLVSAGTITFAQSLGIIFGANIGTTLTSQLVAFQLMDIAPILIIAGFILSLIKSKYGLFGKPLFYLGLVLFSLNLISLAVLPLKNDPLVLSYLAKASFIPIGILAGFIVTNIFQSSTVTTGLVVVLAHSGLIGLPQAIPIIFGANIGTTILSIVVSTRMDVFAKRAALSHFLFNLLGVLMFLPFIDPFILFIESFGGSIAQQVANAHLVFNIIATFVLLIFINYFRILVEKLIPTSEKEIILKTKFIDSIEGKTNKEIISAVKSEIKSSLDSSVMLFNENNAMLLSSNGDLKKISKLASLIDFIDIEIKKVLSKMMYNKISSNDTQFVVRLARTSKLCQQIGFAGKHLGESILYSKEKGQNFSEEGRLALDMCLTKLIENIILVRDNFPIFDKKVSARMRKNEKMLRGLINSSYKDYLGRLASGNAPSGSLFSDALGDIQDIEAKIREIRKINQ